jgi:hypothetical protein
MILTLLVNALGFLQQAEMVPYLVEMERGMKRHPLANSAGQCWRERLH